MVMDDPDSNGTMRLPLAPESAGAPRLACSARATLDRGRYAAQRQHLVDGAELHRLLGHAVNNAAFLILGDGVGAGFVHLAQPAGAVVAHARHDDALSVAARS